MSNVRYTDGIRIDLATGETVACDSEDVTGDVNALSHAHGDHLYRATPGSLVCSELTAALANHRRGEDAVPLERTDHPAIRQVDAGHVAGSRATYVDESEVPRTSADRTQSGDGETVFCYTGDCSTRDRDYLTGFDPEPADVLIIETTYGKPEYVFPEQQELERRIVDWLDEEYDSPVLLFGYSLGRAQKLQRLVARSERDRLFVTKAVAGVNGVIGEHLGIDFGAERYRRETELGAGDALVLPSRTSKLAFVDDIVEETGAIKAGFSGWATNDSFRYRGGYDETFVLSDHCDFSELCDVVRAVDPEQVYTNHGFDEAFADHLATNMGYEARPLKRNQSSLSDF
ncbi:MBL fold metallo-hydrolase RNA specificity domain-containing protein [Halobium salinum]|uniref:MBL fold metallo-hydrolase RNA specificity domain-containing protein n=1 Tax=Halobium salinum TaxID=1364940 RepID=A0ABD5PED9_9EURY|nr:MBL fold metallo-hydrolase RNA specificity domain-containing protein [Halobium salinum]